MGSSKVGTVALVIKHGETGPSLVDAFSDDREIAILEAALESGETAPLESVYEMRERQMKEDEEFGNYVEELLCQPAVRPDVQEHGIQWLKSKLRIEQFQKSETEATQVIAGYAFKLFQEDSQRTDFLLAGPAAKVRIRVFLLPKGTTAISEAA